jgi:hypothetical protein
VLTPQHAQVIRDALAASLTECDLVVEGDGSRCDGSHTCAAPSHVLGCFRSTSNTPNGIAPPADWVALTGACELCGGSGMGDENEGWYFQGCLEPGSVPPCDDCHGTGRKRATLTVRGQMATAYANDWRDADIALAVATVEVLPVHAEAAVDRYGEAHVEVTGQGLTLLFRGNGTEWTCRPITLHRQPVPGKDFVMHLVNLVAA